MNTEKIKKGIAPYHREQKVLLRLIRMTGGLTASRFDELFRNRECRRGLVNHKINGDAFMLGVGINGFNEWAWQLDLLQHMMAIGLVDTKRDKDNGIVYYLPPEDGTPECMTEWKRKFKLPKRFFRAQKEIGCLTPRASYILSRSYERFKKRPDSFIFKNTMFKGGIGRINGVTLHKGG